MQETYSNQSIEAADAIQKSFISNLGRKDRTVKQAGFVVLKYTYMPSVLVEAGFLTNKREGAYLNSKKGQNEIASSVAKAIVDYKVNIQKSTLLKENFTPVNDFVSKINNEIFFRVQIAASKNSIDPKSYNFNGLKPIFKLKMAPFTNIFSQSKNYKQIQKDKKKARKKGLKAFIVAFKGNKQIKLSEALRN